MSNKEKRSRLEKLLCILEGAHRPEGMHLVEVPFQPADSNCPCAPARATNLIPFMYADSKNDQTLRLAAQKIADVALQQPHHIPSVLRQVRSVACCDCLYTTAFILELLLVCRCIRSCTAKNGKPVCMLGMFWLTWPSEWSTAQLSASLGCHPKLSTTPVDVVPTP